MHKNVEQAFQEIDAAIFSGDTFYERAALERLKSMLKRWTKQIDHLDAMAELIERGEQ